MIDITGVDLVKFVKAVYGLSSPQGLGILQAEPGSLTDEEAASLLELNTPAIALSLDYVKGRACKMVVWKRGEKLVINSSWFDHSQSQLERLLSICGLSLELRTMQDGAA